MAADRSSPERHLVVFTLHDEQYAVPIEAVQEIVRYSRPTATAAASGLITGMISLRGSVLPVADLSARLGRELAIDTHTRILVLALKRGPLGLIVDRVDGVQRVASEQISPLPVPAVEAGLGDEIVAIGEQLVLLIEPETVLGPALGTGRQTSRTSARAPSARTPSARKPSGRKPSARKPSARRSES